MVDPMKIKKNVHKMMKEYVIKLSPQSIPEPMKHN